MSYNYKGYIIKQEKITNYYTITIYLNGKTCFSSHSKRLLTKDEFISFIKSVLSLKHKQKEVKDGE